MIALPQQAMTGTELQQLLDEVAATPALWRSRIAFDTADRVSVSIGGNDHVEVWLICWVDAQNTGFHDHDVSRGAAIVVEGEIDEELMAVGRANTRTTHVAGDRLQFPEHHIHCMTQRGDAPTVTLHAYSPPLRYLGRYETDGDTLRRIAAPRDDVARHTDGWDTAAVSGLATV